MLLQLTQGSTILNHDVKYDFDYYDTNGIISTSLNHNSSKRLNFEFSQFQPWYEKSIFGFEYHNSIIIHVVISLSLNHNAPSKFSQIQPWYEKSNLWFRLSWYYHDIRCDFFYFSLFLRIVCCVWLQMLN